MSNYSTNNTNNIKVRSSQTETTRNEKMRAQYKEINPTTGKRVYSIRKLARIYHLSPARTHEIITQEATV